MQLALYLFAAAAAFTPVLAHPPRKASWGEQPERPSSRSNVVRDAGQSSCTYGDKVEISAPLNNIFNALDNDETAAVTAFLHEQSDLNLTAVANATSWDNIIINVELLQPNKSAALPYLNGAGPAPGRYARAAIQFQATDKPYIQDYMVGPLPVSDRTTIQLLNYYYNNGNGRQRVYNADLLGQMEFYGQIGADIEDITLDLWNGTHRGLPNDTLFVKGIEPLWKERGRIISWTQFWNFPGEPIDDRVSLLPLGLYVKTDITGRDISKWSVKGWYYNGIFYKSTKAFKKAFNSPGFEKLGANVDGPWSKTGRLGEELPRDDIPPPVSIQPEGQRFGVDVKQKYVEWMDFSFYIGFTRDTGVRLFDIRYKGERIIYELGLEEALSHYASSDPMQSGVAYLDTYDGFGRGAFELVGGFDCPSYATYLNNSIFTDETTRTHMNSICLFEIDPGFPLQRHASPGFVGATKNIVFTLRSVSTIGNYDFMFEYAFHLDGAVYVTIRLSGYIQAAYWAHNSDYGYKIHDNLSGSMHDHVINYKLDLDINGTANSLMKSKVVPARESYPWSDRKYPWLPREKRNTMKLEKSFITNERDSKLNWLENSPATFVVVNKDSPNKYGEYRGYKIAPVTHNMPYLTVQDSSNLKDAANWAKNHLYVVKQKDTELHSASPYNALDAENPAIDFDKFFDGESLDQEDLVVYFNLGMHHIPDTSDLPNTVTTHAHSSIAIAPHNYLTSNPSRATFQQIRVNFGEGKPSEIDDYGSRPATCQYDMEHAMANLTDYRGDLVVRKFPYAPQNPFFPPGGE